MSDTNKITIPKYGISAPGLNDTNYATNLNNVFNNINENFIQLANRNFVKGESGSAVHVKNVSFTDTITDDNEMTFQKLLIDTFENKYDANLLKDITTSNGEKITLWDNFNKEIENGTAKLQMICNIESDNGIDSVDKPVSSLYYVFLDGRFANSSLSYIDIDNYKNSIQDLSCILVYSNIDNEPKFTILENAFPTIYYEDEVGLCWKVNGNSTGIPVQGIQGKNGENSKLYIVKSTQPIETADSEKFTFTVPVTHIFDGMDGFQDVDTFIKNNDDEITEGLTYTALILCPSGNTNNNENGDRYYFGIIKTEKDDNGKIVINAISDTKTSIDMIVQNEAFITSLKSINMTSKTGLPGLFIPLEDKQSNGSQKVHLFTATTITNEEGQTNNKNTDLILTPVNDINQITLDKANEDVKDKTLIVEKYMYLKVNKDQFDYLFNIEQITDDDFKNENTYCKELIKDLTQILEKSNYILKYRLVNTINNITSLEKINFIRTNTETPTTISITDFNKISGLNILNRPYKNNTENFGIISDNNYISKVCIENSNENVVNNSINYTYNLIRKENFYNLIPDTFNDKIDAKVGIYQWDLVFDTNDFDLDVEELKNLDNSPFKSFIKNENIDLLLSFFKTVYTTTVSPSLNDDILWFNGITLNTNTKYNLKDLKNTGRVTTLKPDDETESGVNSNYKDVTYNYTYIDYSKDNYFKDKSVYILNGWECNKTLSFTKYIPIYTNHYKLDEDTVLNINYNINITGDNNVDNKKYSNTKNLKVHGNINAENIKTTNADIYELTVDKINNIYTENEIKSDTGINTKNVISEYVESTSIKVIDKITTNDISTNDLSTKYTSVKSETFKPGNAINETNENVINIESTNKINISKSKTINELINFGNIAGKGENILKLAKYNPVISNNIPVNNINDTPLIVSNTDIESQELCVKGIPQNYYIESNNKEVPGGQFLTDNTEWDIKVKEEFKDDDTAKESPTNWIVTAKPYFNKIEDHKIIDNTDFDTIKNFNINRLSLKSIGISSKNTHVSKNLERYDYTKIASKDLTEEARKNTSIQKLNDGYRKLWFNNNYTWRDWVRNYSDSRLDGWTDGRKHSMFNDTNTNYNMSHISDKIKQTYLHKYTLNRNDDNTNMHIILMLI